MGFIRSDLEENAVFVQAKQRSRGGAIRKFQGFSNCLSPRRAQIIRRVCHVILSPKKRFSLMKRCLSCKHRRVENCLSNSSEGKLHSCNGTIGDRTYKDMEEKLPYTFLINCSTRSLFQSYRRGRTFVAVYNSPVEIYIGILECINHLGRLNVCFDLC